MPDVAERYHKIVALRNEKGSYNGSAAASAEGIIVALRNEKGSYNRKSTSKPPP